MNAEFFEANRIRTAYNWLQYFDVEDLRRELAGCGLKLEPIVSRTLIDKNAGAVTVFAFV